MTQFLFIFSFQPFYKFFLTATLNITSTFYFSISTAVSQHEAAFNIPMDLVLSGDKEADFDSILVHDCYKMAKLLPNLPLIYLTQD